MRVMRGARVVGAVAAAIVVVRGIVRRDRGATTGERGTPGPAEAAALGRSIDRRVLSWARQAPGPPDGGPALSPEREREALATLRGLSEGMDEGERRQVQDALASGRVRVRALSPDDGLVWEIPGRRFFDIEGVQTFGVADAGRPGPGTGDEDSRD